MGPAMHVGVDRPVVGINRVEDLDRFLRGGGGIQVGEGPPVDLATQNREVVAEVAEIGQLDIGIMPLTDDLWARGKCALKIVQYLAVGVPVVCSPVGMNRDIVRDGVNGFWTTTKREWVDRLGVLIEDPELRKQMGLAGRKIVEERYSLQVVGERLIELFKGL